jgi:hypothetical protein
MAAAQRRLMDTLAIPLNGKLKERCSDGVGEPQKRDWPDKENQPRLVCTSRLSFQRAC